MQTLSWIGYNVLTPAAALGAIIFVHELGHLLVARAFGIRVLAFSLGFGRRLWGIRRGETDYRVSLVPLGGYVKLAGEQPDEASDDPRDFVNRPRWQRVIVYLAGPAMNVVLAITLIAIVFMVGIVMPPRNLAPVVGLVIPGLPGEAAGLASGDRIVSVDGKPISDFNQVQMAILTAPERTLTIAYERGGQRFETALTPVRVPRLDLGDAGLTGPGHVVLNKVVPGTPAARAGLRLGDEILAVGGRTVVTLDDFFGTIRHHPPGEELAIELQRGGRVLQLAVVPEGEPGAARIGVYPDFGTFQRYPLGRALLESAYYNLDLARQTFVIVGKIFSREVAAKSALSGPIGIVTMTGAEAERGLRYLLRLVGFISLSIALVNLLPIPILDGGQIAILAIEGALRRNLSTMVKERLAQVGLVLILLLLIAVVVFDIQKL
jgi:regulator of sigma E protease